MDFPKGVARLRLAQASVGAVQLGIPVDTVVQAIPLPDAPAVLPRRQGALRCVVEHRGTLVPVVDLARWVDVGTTSTPGYEARILVLREGGRTIGLQVDALRGLVDVPAQDLARLHHDDNPEDVFHSAVRAPGSGTILSLLEVGRLADLACAWSGIEATGSTGDGAAQAPAAARVAVTYALLQTAHGRLAVPPGELAAVIRMPALSSFGGGIGGAWCDWRGRHLPVLADGAVTGNAPAGGTDALLAVIEHGGLALGVPVRAALHLCSFDSPGLPVPGGVTATVFDADGTEIHLLDTARLFARFPEAALSRPAAASPSAMPGRDKRPVNACAYIVFEAGGIQATPIGTVEHILPLAATSSTMDWRGEAIPLVDLRPSSAAGTAGHVLVVRGAGRPAGYVVASVHTLVPPGAGTLYRMGAATGQPLEFITTGEGSEQASYRIVDLTSGPVNSGSEHKLA